MGAGSCIAICLPGKYMRFFKKITLSAAPFYASLVVITSLAFFIGIFWSFNEYQAYQQSVENIKTSYRLRYQARLQEEVEKVAERIDYRRQQYALRVEQDIRQRLQAAYTIASHNYRLYKEEKSLDEIRSMVVELLRPIRWNNGRGYHFAGRIKDGIIDLFGDEPFFEGKPAAELNRATGHDVVGDIVAIVQKKEAGLYRYTLKKPGFVGQNFAKIAFVKYFPPLDWYIGAGTYSDELEDTVQQEVIGRIQNISFGKDGEVFLFRADGTILSNQDERLIGRSINDLVDVDGFAYGQAFLQETAPPAGQGYVQYRFKGHGDNIPHHKLAYVRAYKEWGWRLGAAMFMDAMEESIVAETEAYKHISFKNVFTFIALFGVAVCFLLLSTLFYSYKIKKGITLLTDFFRKAADSKVKIADKDLAFREFEDLAHLANRMVDERLKNEVLLHRNELRLDTLLHLGTMEKYSLQEKYDFLLRRIVQITRSEEGYLALVNNSQSHISICSFIVFNDEDIESRAGQLSLPRSLENGGLPGNAVRRKKAVIANSLSPKTEHIYPYQNQINRHLDVPVFSDGKIVLIGGVCNNSESYDNTDIRQMTMLLEGMWLHVLHQVSEEERARLERQIIAVSEEERSNIGRDLHDDLGSHLTGIELLAKVLEQQLKTTNPERLEQVKIIRDLIRDAIDKTRRLSQGLYPVHLAEYGLQSAIEELVIEVEKLFKVQFDFFWEGEEEHLGKNSTTHLHYIIREAVFNGARHGKPSRIAVHMTVQQEGFSVTITDNGSGFEGKPAATGLGFHTMKYRARAIGAELAISSAASGGTIIEVTGEGVE
jgi:signal transduction histidine kinase